MNHAIDRAMELFPELANRQGSPASSLSGGQQQMLALAQVLVTDTDVLIIDELSLGLAPIMVERLVKVIEQLRRQGMTIIVVEQSLNIALAIADRAVFLEKGHVRFEGDIQELAGRDDLARAVFLGSDGG
jgi:ABC-type branched-subunit amino acid transport system ATPase component